MVEIDNLVGLVPEKLLEMKEQKMILSYSKMCKFLGIQQKGGTAKKKQLEQLKDYCSYRVVKDSTTKYLVMSCGTLKEIEDKRKKGFISKRQGVFFPIIEEMLFKMLEKDTTLYFAKKQLLFELGLVGKNFKYITNEENRRMLAEDIGCTEESLEIFSSGVFYKLLWPLVNRVLLRLQDEGKIILNTGFMYKVKGRKNLFKALPDSELGKEMITVEATVLKKMGKTKSKLVTPFLRAKYRENCNNLLRESYKNIEFFFECIGIYTSEEIVKTSLEELREKLNKLSVQKCLNTSTLDKLTGEVRKLLTKDTISFEPTKDYGEILKVKKYKESLDTGFDL